MLTAQLCGKGVVIAQNRLAGAADADGCLCKHGGHIHILLEIGVCTGLLGDAVAPADEHMTLLRHGSHADSLSCAGHIIGQCRLAAVAATGQGTAAVLIHTIGGLIQHALPFGRACSLRAAGCSHCRAGICRVFRAFGNVGGIRAAVIGLVSMGAQVAQQCLEAGGLQVDVPALIVVLTAIAVGILQHLGRIEELQAHLLTHGQQRHIEVVDLGLIHIGIVRVVCRHRRHRVHDDIGIGVALLNGLHQRGVIIDELFHRHAVVVGAQHDDHAAGLHFGHCLRDGVAVVVLFKGDDALGQGRVGANALLGAELLQADKAVCIQAHRVGIADEQGLFLIVLARIGGLRQQGAGGLVDLIVIRDILFTRHQHLAGGLLHRGGGVLAALEQGQRNADGQNSGQRAHRAHQHRLLLHGGK